MTLDVIAEACKSRVPRNLLFADDLVVIASSEEKLQRRWSHWQKEMEKKGLEVNT